MRYILVFSYINVETSKTSNGILFKRGDTLFIRGTRSFAGGGWPNSIDGVYTVVEVINRPGLVVTGSATAGWGQGSINMPMNGITVSGGGGAVINNAMTVPVGIGISTDWWLHAITSPDSQPVKPPLPLPISLPRSTPPPQAPRPVIDPGPPPRDNGNDLDTGDGRFNIDQFIARANFKLGTSPAANNKGAAQFIAAATRAAKSARLTKAQTKKLLDAVNKAIADAKSKAKNKPLPKPKGRR
jgi:hypothetical protein